MAKIVDCSSTGRPSAAHRRPSWPLRGRLAVACIVVTGQLSAVEVTEVERMKEAVRVWALTKIYEVILVEADWRRVRVLERRSI